MSNKESLRKLLPTAYRIVQAVAQSGKRKDMAKTAYSLRKAANRLDLYGMDREALVLNKLAVDLAQVTKAKSKEDITTGSVRPIWRKGNTYTYIQYFHWNLQDYSQGQLMFRDAKQEPLTAILQETPWMLSIYGLDKAGKNYLRYFKTEHRAKAYVLKMWPEILKHRISKEAFGGPKPKKRRTSKKKY